MSNDTTTEKRLSDPEEIAAPSRAFASGKARGPFDLPAPPRWAVCTRRPGQKWGTAQYVDPKTARTAADVMGDDGWQVCLMEATWRPILMPVDLGGEPAPGVEVCAAGDVPVRDIVETMLCLAEISAPTNADHLRKGARLLAALAERFERRTEEAERASHVGHRSDGSEVLVNSTPFSLERSLDGVKWTAYGEWYDDVTAAAFRMRSLVAVSTQFFRVIHRGTGEVVAGPVEGGLDASRHCASGHKMRKAECPDCRDLLREGRDTDGLTKADHDLVRRFMDRVREVDEKYRAPASLRMAQERYDLADALLDLAANDELKPSDSLLGLADSIIFLGRPEAAPKTVDCDADGWEVLTHFERLARQGVEEIAGEVDGDEDVGDVAVALIRGVAFGMSPKLAQAMRFALDGVESASRPTLYIRRPADGAYLIIGDQWFESAESKVPPFAAALPSKAGQRFAEKFARQSEAVDGVVAPAGPMATPGE